jgi:hypothetical protein
MAYFEDLSPYSYLASKQGENAINVGWLDDKHAYPLNDVPTKAKNAALALCLRPVNKTRGYHACPFCKPAGLGVVVEENGRKITLGSSEIRITNDGKTYVAPDLIYHYITAHGYCPPEEFITALMNSGNRWKREC